MRDMIIGGGLGDVATLHPLSVLIVLGAALLVVRIAMRGVGLQQRRIRSNGRPQAL